MPWEAPRTALQRWLLIAPIDAAVPKRVCMLQLSIGHRLGILAIQALIYDWHWDAWWWFDPATVNQIMQ